MNVTVRQATPADASGIFSLINELAVYEKAGDEVVVTPEQLATDLKSERFQAFIAEVDGEIGGMALFYPVYSTWKGLSYYLEDIVVKEALRRKGIGNILFNKVAEYAARENAGRLGWQVLDWNTPAIEFYKKFSAQFDETWVNCKLTNEQLTEFLDNK